MTDKLREWESGLIPKSPQAPLLPLKVLIIDCPSIPFCSYPQELSPSATVRIPGFLLSPQHLNCPPCCGALARVFPYTPGDSCPNPHPNPGLNPTDFTTAPRQQIEMEPLDHSLSLNTSSEWDNPGEGPDTRTSESHEKGS